MKFPTLGLAALATAGLAVGGELTPIPAAPYHSGPTYPAAQSYEPAPLPAPSYEPAPAYDLAPTHAPVPTYGPAPAPQASYYAPPVAAPVHGVAARPLPVKYKDTRKIAPCAVPQTVCVNGECGVQYVDICAPEGCVDVKHKKNKTVFDYGDYQVEIHEKRGRLVVDYDD